MIVSDEAFAYLVVQKGSLWDVRGDRKVWEAAHADSLSQQFASIAPWLPAHCDAFLDVGSGLGGIDVLISRALPGAALWLLDGEATPPRVEFHRQPFNDMLVAHGFLADNGAKLAGFYTAEAPAAPDDGRRFDLVVSFGAWCFHLAPETYLDFVRAHLVPGATLILEVRRDKPAWRAALASAFEEAAVICEAPKFNRIVYRA